MSAPISPRHRPSADEVPDGMSLLYADLPPKPDPPPQRARLDLAVTGLLAAAGVAAAGSGIAGDVLGRFVRPDAGSASPSDTAPFTGVERIVDQPVVVAPALAPVAESDFSMPPADEAALAVVEPRAVPPALPASPAPPRDVTLSSSRPGPTPAPAPTTTTSTVPPTTTSAPPTTAAPATTLPSTATVPPTTAVPSTTAVPPTTTTAPTPADGYVLALEAGYEVSPTAAATIARDGFAVWVEQQLTPTAIADPVVDGLLSGYALMDQDPDQLESAGLAPAALAEARWADFTRLAFSERQVEAQLARLWRNWFALPADDTAGQLELDQIVRAGALGPYAELLAGVAQSRALLRSHGVGAPTIEELVDSSLAERILVDWVHGPDAAIDDVAIGALAAAIVDGLDATVVHLSTVLAAQTGPSPIGALIGVTVAGPGSVAADAAAAAFVSSGGHIGASVRAALLDGRFAVGRPLAAVAWLVRSLRRAGATLTIGGAWDPDDPTSVAGILRELDAEPGTGLRFDDDERSPAALASRWRVARALAGGGAGIVSGLSGAAPATAMPAAAVVGAVSSLVDVSLGDQERAALLGYLDADPVAEVVVDTGVFLDLCGLAMAFPTALERVEQAA